jgi:hypothetical protein
MHPSVLTVIEKGALRRPGKPTPVGYLVVLVVGAVLIAASMLWVCRGP